MKTPEEMAEEWMSKQRPFLMDRPLTSAFLAGYKAAQPQWIPVSEAMPDKFIDVLVKLKDHRSGDYWIGFDYSASKRTWSERWEHSEVVAWMPLPEMEEWKK